MIDPTGIDPPPGVCGLRLREDGACPWHDPEPHAGRHASSEVGPESHPPSQPGWFRTGVKTPLRQRFALALTPSVSGVVLARFSTPNGPSHIGLPTPQPNLLTPWAPS